MSELLAEQFERFLDGLPRAPLDAAQYVNESGYLGLLTPEEAGGAGLLLQDIFPLGVAVGRRLIELPLLEQILARGSSRGAEETPRATAAAGAAVLMVGAMETLMDMTVRYVTVRKQFGREIGKFQAVQHQIAVMAEEVLAARMAAQIAFVGRADEITPERAAVAKIRAGEAAQIVVAVAHALHGAIGISEELPLHCYAANLRRWRLAHGGESWWAKQLGHAVLAGDGATDYVSQTLC